MFQISRREQLIILILLAVLVFWCGYRYAEYKLADSEQPLLVQPENEPAESKKLTVHVTGAVDKPGVYHLEGDARIIDAVELAVPKADADLNRINLAAPLTDGEQIIVPVKTDQPNLLPQSAENMQVFYEGKININTAGIDELDQLPGIGPALAERIIEYREANGGFKSIEEIKNVPGIGDKKFADIKDKISIY